MNALILAAGLGTRLGDLTSDRPKALVEVSGKTMLEHQLHHLSAAGFDRFVINIHHFAPKVKAFLEEHRNFGLDIRLSDESDLLLDTGGGIRKAMHMFGDGQPVLVHNVDIFSSTDLRSLYEGHLESGADSTLLVAARSTSRYLYFDSDSMLRGWSNEKTGQVRSPYPGFDKTGYTPYAFQGIHVLSPSLLPLLDEIPGVGEKRRKALLRAFGSAEGVRDATLDQLAHAPSMNEASAKKVYEFFHAQASDS
jgi:NDP-sugar pyrophosphorylase family protein